VYGYWFFAGPAIALALFSLRGERRRAAYCARRLAESPGRLPPATVIVPVKGPEEGLRENLAALASLHYPDYELIVVARTAADIPPAVLPRRVRVVLAHGSDPGTGEKVQNLRAAVRAVRQRSEILAFADSDGRPGPDWLRALAAPLSEPGVGASTGFRWFTPRAAGFWDLLRAVWDRAACGMLGPGDNPFAWGGAMALRKQVFFELRIADAWQNTISDDYALAGAVHDAGLSIAFAPGALTPGFEPAGGPRVLGWMRRQMTITRVYCPRLWRQALAAHILNCAGMAASAAAAIAGSRAAAWALAAQLVPGMLKGLNSARLARAALPEGGRWFRRQAWAHTLWVPLATWLWLAVLLSSAWGNTLEWRGYRYELKRPA
jgi:ceramide glucosyltransferase